MKMTYDDAYDMGRERGANAGEWYFDGNSDDATYAATLRGIEDGDPAILDTFPSFTFGEWAGDSCAEIFPDWDTMDDDRREEATNGYCDGYSDGAADMIEATARQHTEGE
jgi:hypothetical protein